MLKFCLTCNKEFITYLSKVKIGGGKYCSIKCSFLRHSTKPKSGKIVECLTCKKKFYSYACWIKSGRGKYCSRKCSAKPYITHVKKVCLVCNKHYFIHKNEEIRGIRQYCSRKCYHTTTFGEIKICPICNKKFYSFRSDKKYHKRTCCSWKCFIKWKSGKNHWNWQGGKSKLNKTQRQLEMNTWQYKQWRRAVFKRDNYTCVLCGKKGNGDLNADHIKRWVDFPELRYDINNGRTLCVLCHRKTFTYSGKHKILLDN